MFAKTIIDSDAFLDMPLSTQALYFHLSMRADDDGFINNPRKIQRMIGCADDDLKVLIAKRFIIPFESGIVVIKHWKIHNYLRNDRYKETVYKEEKALLTVKANGAYTVAEQAMLSDVKNGIPMVYQMDTQYRLGKDSIGKDSIEIEEKKTASRFHAPTIDEVKAYCQERGNNVDAQRWFDYYESNGWKVGRNAMKDWKAAVRTWERNGIDSKGPTQTQTNPALAYAQRQYDDDDFQSGDYMKEAAEFMKQMKGAEK